MRRTVLAAIALLAGMMLAHKAMMLDHHGFILLRTCVQVH